MKKIGDIENKTFFQKIILEELAAIGIKIPKSKNTRTRPVDRHTLLKKIYKNDFCLCTFKNNKSELV